MLGRGAGKQPRKLFLPAPGCCLKCRLNGATLIAFGPRRPGVSTLQAALPGSTVKRMEPRISYVICTNPRSGSWLLAEGLASTGLAGNPREWFHEGDEEEECRRAGIAREPAAACYSAYLAHVKKAATSANGTLGLKLMYYQLEGLPRKVCSLPACRNLARSRLLPAMFPNIQHIWLTRHDKVRQAISLHRAGQTDVWWEKDGRRPPARPDALPEPVFDPHNIERLENFVIESDAGWQRYFDEAAVKPLVIAYEELAADYEGTIRRVLKWLGFPKETMDGMAIAPPMLAKQADAKTEEWVELYGRFKRGQLSPAASDPIPDAWKAWIGENKLMRAPDADIVEVLVKQGFPREAAAAEVERANSDPYLRAGQWMLQRLKKAESHFGVYRALASLCPQAGTVERRANVSRAEFLQRYYSANRPVVLEGLMDGWKAMRVWSPEYLKRILGNEEVEIMAARDNDANFEINCDEHRRKTLFGSYIDMVHSGAETNDYYLVANNGFLNRPAARQLLQDIEMFPEYLDAAGANGSVFFWYGPAGTVTPLHHDTLNILMAQVWGRKRVKLISPNDLEFIYNDVGVYSKVDPDNPDLMRWPNFRKATVTEVMLGPGEVLFLPVGWWHHVRALDVSLTISFTNFAFSNQYEWNLPQIKK